MASGGNLSQTVPKLYPAATTYHPEASSAASLYPAVPEIDGIDPERAPSLRESLTDKRLKALKPAPAGQRYTIHDAWCSRPASARVMNDLLLDQIRAIHDRSRATYGVPRIYASSRSRSLRRMYVDRSSDAHGA